MNARKSIPLAVIALLCCNSPEKEKDTTAQTLRRSIESGLPDCARCFTSAASGSDWESLDSLVEKIAAKFSTLADRRVKARLLTTYLLDTLGIAFDTSRNDPENINPAAVARNKRGSCLGISLLMLIAGEKTGLPLHGVLVPGHFFVRYDDGTATENIDAMKKGSAPADSWYAGRFGVPDGAACYLKNLNKEETLAALRYTIGNILLSEKKHPEAVACYSWAISAMPDFIEALGNYSIALAAMGKTDSALAIAASLDRRHPGLKNMDLTIGKLLIGKGDYTAALARFASALRGDPRNPELLFCAGLSCRFLKRFDESERFLMSALEIEPGFKDARQLLAEVRKLKRRAL